jgi:hypothetical protein
MSKKSANPNSVRIPILVYLIVAFTNIKLCGQTLYAPGSVGSSSTDNVGIGTASPVIWFPSKGLEIRDTRPVLKVNSTSTLGTILLTSQAVNSSTHVGEFHLNYSYNSGTPDQSSVSFNSYPAANILNVLSNGNVGIGTISPNSKLHVKYEAPISSITANPVSDMLNITLQTRDGFVPALTEQRINFKLQDWDNGDATFGVIGVQKEADASGIYGGGKINFYNFAPARGANQPSPGLVNTFSIDRFGNTSILSTTHYESINQPNTILRLRFHTPNAHVPYGTENRISFRTKAFNNSEDEIGAISFRVGDAEPSSYGGGELLFYTKDSSPGGNEPGQGLLERMRIDNKGRVGIGTNDPDAKLTVKGDIHTREVKVDMTGSVGPDYVFEKDYDLLSLQDIEAYVNENKHLPEVPSAKEFDANGMNLKEMNLILLKKVEELTLHAIGANKKMETLLEKSSAQQKEIKALQAYVMNPDKK